MTIGVKLEALHDGRRLDIMVSPNELHKLPEGMFGWLRQCNQAVNKPIGWRITNTQKDGLLFFSGYKTPYTTVVNTL